MKSSCNPQKIIVLLKGKHIIYKAYKNKRERGKQLKIFYTSTFIKKEELEEAGINYPIKLEYYKIINEDEIMKGEKARFGIKVIKTEYKNNDTKTEEKEITYLSNDEKKIEEILTLFKENEVTPISVEDIVYDLWKKAIQI